MLPGIRTGVESRQVAEDGDHKCSNGGDVLGPLTKMPCFSLLPELARFPGAVSEEREQGW